MPVSSFPAYRLCAALVLLSPVPAWAQGESPSWIWSQAKPAKDEVIHLRKVIPLEGGETIRVTASCDNVMTLFFNGKEVGASKNWSEPVSADLTASAVKGGNVFAARAANVGAGIAGFIAKIEITKDGKTSVIGTDASWKVSATGEGNWNAEAGFKDDAWNKAVVLFPIGKGPWRKHITAETFGGAAAPAVAGKGKKESGPPVERKPGSATAVSSIKVKEGFKVELLHSVDMTTRGSWVASCFDDKGRLIVSDQYGGLFRVTPPAIGGKAADTKIEPIPVPLGEAQGLCWAFDSLYVITNSSKFPRGLYRVKDTDNDDTLDKVETLRLFANKGGEHGPHAVLPGPDGDSLYVVVGNQTAVTEMDRSRVPTHWAEDSLLDPPLIGRGFMRNVMAPGGWVAKTDKDGKNWELITSGFRNQYDAAFDKHGSMFTFDADMEWDQSLPWYRPTRVCEVISGGDYGWRALSKKWPVRWEDGLPPVIDIGPGSPTGVTFGYGTKFPAKYQNALYIADWSYGKLYAVHLQPDGAGYRAEVEEFVTANPLPLTDLSVNPKDGAMYFMIGGRRVQSGLYRIVADKPEGEAPAPSAPPLLELRRTLEAYHGKVDPGAIAAVWPYLGHEDRLIRHAARIAVEHQPFAQWKDRALAEKDPRASLNVLMAVCRSSDGDKVLLAPVLDALKGIDFKGLDSTGKETWVRAHQLAFARFGAPDETRRTEVAGRLAALFPVKEPLLDVDLAEILVFLGEPSVVGKALPFVESAPTQQEQISHAKNLRLAKAGWTPELRERFFRWVCLKAPTYKGGASFPAFMQDIKRDAVALLTDAEKEALKPILDSKPKDDGPTFDFSGRKFVKNWTVKDLDPLLASGLEGGRDFANGRNLFGATTCFACHRFGSEGGAIGPDLSSVAGKYSPRDLLVHIIEPSKEISDQYGQLEVTMNDGSSVFGRIVNLSGDRLNINTDMTNPHALERIDRSLIKSMEDSKVSMMPPGLLDTCSDTDILDLLAYLLSKGDKEDPLFK